MKINNETKIGILVTFVTVMLLGLTFRVGNFNFTKKGYTLKIHFYRIEGLEKNAPIRLNGLEVGAIRNIHILYEPETVMELTAWLDESAKVHQGAQAYVKNMGLLGEKYIELTGGDNGTPFLTSDSLIIGQEPVDFEKLLAKGDTIADSLKSISQNLDERLKVNSQSIDSIIKDLAAISHNINERLTVNRQAIDEIVANLHTATMNLEEFSGDLKMNPWKLMYRNNEKKKTQEKVK